MSKNLRIPGPTHCRADVLEAMGKQMIDPRSEFKHLLLAVTDKLKCLLDTNNDILILTASGTGGLQAAVENFIAPRQNVIVTRVGYFGDRFAEIARRHGAYIAPIEKEWGTAVKPEELEDEFKRRQGITAVLITHNETSTGVTNDLRSLAAVAKQYGALVIVDAVSSLGAIPCEIDEWGCDVVVTASQKGWGVPPGLSIVVVSEQAWHRYRLIYDQIRTFYFDLGMAKEYLKKGQTPFTPAISQFFGLEVALDWLLSQTMHKVFEDTHKVASHFRSRLPEIGARLFPDASIASDTVSAITFGDGVDHNLVAAQLDEHFDVKVSGGMNPLSGKILRVGNLGCATNADMDEVIEGLKSVRQNKKNSALA